MQSIENRARTGFAASIEEGRAASTLLREYPGDLFVDAHAAIKRTGQGRFDAVVPTLDHDRYLHDA